MNENETVIRNQDVPIETVFRWKQVECWRLKAQNKKQEATIRALQHNIQMLLKDKDLKKEIAKEAAIRQRTVEINRLNRKLSNAYRSIEELILTKLKLEAKLYEQGSN